MAAHTIAAGNVAKHDVTLTASTVDTFTFEDDLDAVQIISDGTAKAYFTLDGSTPTVSGAACYPIPAAACVVEQQPRTGGVTVVKIISAGAPTITVARAR